VPTTTVHRLDGHVFAIGTVSHLSSHWAEKHERLGSETRDVAIRIAAVGGEHLYDERWRWTYANLTTSGPIKLVEAVTKASAWENDLIVEPLGEPGVPPISNSAPPLWFTDDAPSPVQLMSIVRSGVAVDLPTGVYAPLTMPLPGWHCTGIGTGAQVVASASVVFDFGRPGRSGFNFELSLDVQIDGVSCAAAPVPDAGSPDAGPPDAGPPDAGPGIDAGPGMLGASCMVPADCASGFCADGVCCNTRCDGECMSCVAATSRSPNGTCDALLEDTNPDGECPGLQKCQAYSTTPGATAYCRAHYGDPCTGDYSSVNCPGAGRCIEGVCCDNNNCHLSVAPCSSCLRIYTGLPDGDCQTILAPMDPYDECRVAGSVCWGGSAATGCCFAPGTTCVAASDCCSRVCTAGTCT